MNRVPIDVSLTAGLNERADLRGLQVTAASKMINCIHLKDGAVEKRLGTTTMGTTAANAAVNGGSYKGYPWVSDGFNLNVWSDAKAGFTSIDKLPEVGVLDRIPITGQQANIIDVDFAYIPTLRILISVHLVLLTDGGTQAIFWRATDAVTGAVIVDEVNVDAALPSVSTPRLVLCGSTLLLLYSKPSVAASLFARKMNVTSATTIASGFATETAFVTNLGITGASCTVFDACALDATHFAFAYQTATQSGVNEAVALRVQNLSYVQTQSANFNTGTITTVTSVAVRAVSGETIWCAYKGNIGGTKKLRIAGLLDGGSALTPVDVDSDSGSIVLSKMAIERVSSTEVALFYSNNSQFQTSGAPQAYAFTKVQHCTNTAGTMSKTGGTWKAAGIQLASRPVKVGSIAYGLVYNPSTVQGQTYLVAWDCFGNDGDGSVGYPVRAVVSFAPRLYKQQYAQQTVGNSLVLPNMVNATDIASTVWMMPGLYSTSPNHMALVANVVDFGSTLRHQSAELGDELEIACGVPTLYDGTGCAEFGFTMYPEIDGTALVQSSTGGGLVPGLYSYIFVWEWYDAAGYVHQSGTSPAVSITIGAGTSTNKVTFTLPMLSLIRTGRNCYLVPYRTAVNGSVYYRTVADPPPAGLLNNGQTINGFSYVDTAGDVAITANAVLYTTGGTLDNLGPPASRICIQHKGRLWLAGCDNPRQVWASQALVDGVAPGYNEQLMFLATGAVRAMASLDGKLVLFVQRGAQYGIEFITGEGPFATGAGSDWTTPQPIPSDVGAVDQRGTITGPFGVLFHSTVGGPTSSGGIFLLTRDLQTQYVSGPVQAELVANPVITAAILHPTNGRVYLYCAPVDVGATTGLRLVWDYLHGGVWSVDKLYATLSDTASATARCAWVANAGSAASFGPPAILRPMYATGAGNCYVESVGTEANAYLDGSTWVAMSYSTAFLRPSLDGFARFWRVLFQGDRRSDHDFTMTLTYDFAPSSYYSEASTWTRAQIAAMDRTPIVEVQMIPGNQKAKALQIALVDATPTGGTVGTGQGPSWAGFTLDLGVKEGAFRNIPPAQRA